MSASRQLRRRTLASEVAESLRDMILTGELAPGGRMTQDELARLLGVSTMPVREALLRLAAEGFLDVSPNRSFTVVRTTREDILDVYWVHSALAGELTRRACERADGELIATLRELHERCLEAMRSGALEGMEKANWAFHRAINAAAESPKLLLVLGVTLRFIPQGFYALVPEWGAASERGHEAILDAFERGDPDAARAAAAEHVRDAGELLVRYFTSKGYWTRPTTA